LCRGGPGGRRSGASSGKGLAGAGNRTGEQDRAAAGFAVFGVDIGAVIGELCAAEVDAKLKAAQATLNAKIQNLNLKDAHAGLVVARKALTDYDDQALTYVRAALGSGAVMLLLVGSFFLVVAIVGM